MEQLTEKIIQHKKDLIKSLAANEPINSIRDFGGMWKVNGLYLTYGAEILGCSKASMIDKLKTPEYDAEVERLKAKGIKFEYQDLDFREPISNLLEDHEVSMLNDVLLHQDNFTEVVKQVTKCTEKYIVVIQPFYEGFTIPSSCALIQFMPKDWKQKLYNIMWVDQRELDEYSVDIWMWAQSQQLMIDLFKGYGWTPKQDRGFTFPIENNWHYTGIVFEKK